MAEQLRSDHEALTEEQIRWHDKPSRIRDSDCPTVMPTRTVSGHVPGKYGDFAKLIQVIMVDGNDGSGVCRKFYTTDGDLLGVIRSDPISGKTA